MKKILLYSILALFVFVGFKVASASVYNGYLNPSLDTGISGITKAAPTVSPAAGTYTSAQTVTLTAASATKICYTTGGTTPACATATTCTTGTDLASGGTVSVPSSMTVKSAACYADDSTGPVASFAYTISISSGGGGGGGGGSSTPTCTSVTYSGWSTTCFGNFQTRSVVSTVPSACTLTSAQQTAAQRNCQAATPTEPATPAAPTETPATPATSAVPANATLENILLEAGILDTKDTTKLLNHLGGSADNNLEQANLKKFKTILGLDKALSAEEKMTVNDFIAYGTVTTKSLGDGQRASVINSYFQAYKKLPNNEAEWSDVIKIANGRWPVERNVKAENQAKLEFKKVYARNAVMTNNIDENAIMVIAYGLLPFRRNLNSEKVAVKTFRWVYAHDPVNALAWNIVRAIAYSGAKR